MNHSSRVCFEFGPFRIDTQRHLLFRGNEPVQLSPKAFQILLLLLQNRHRVVKKEELISTIWPDSYVEESNLAQNVFMLRKALREQKNEHAYIMTIPGTGYRFVAPVIESDISEHHINHFILRKSEDAQCVPSIAVLPFEPLVEDGRDNALGPGLTDALITKLSELKNIRVRPTLSVLKYRDARHDALRIGDELNVDFVVVGTFHREGDQIRVSVQLVQVSDGLTLWGAKFDQNFTNLFSIQDSVSEQVVQALASLFGPAIRLRPPYWGIVA
jgi:DNA-binding winged helix-turn-helix (wHTH) protein